MIDWQARIIMDAYKARLAEAQYNYDTHQALYADIRSSDVPLKILRFAGVMLVSLGKRFQRWGGTPTEVPQNEIC
jgi:hypothetical protein